MKARQRKVYIDPTTGKYYALFVGQNVSSLIVESEYFPSGKVIIYHNQDSTALIPRLYTENNEELIPSDFKIINENRVDVYFDVAFSGTIKLLFFNPKQVSLT